MSHKPTIAPPNSSDSESTCKSRGLKVRVIETVPPSSGIAIVTNDEPLSVEISRVTFSCSGSVSNSNSPESDVTSSDPVSTTRTLTASIGAPDSSNTAPCTTTIGPVPVPAEPPPQPMSISTITKRTEKKPRKILLLLVIACLRFGRQAKRANRDARATCLTMTGRIEVFIKGANVLAHLLMKGRTSLKNPISNLWDSLD